MSLGLAKAVHEDEDVNWKDYEAIAAKVNEVSRPGDVLMSDEEVYFLLRRTPPSGMELDDSHKLELSPDLSKRFHVVNGSELDRRIKAGFFDTLQTCDDDEYTAKWGLDRIYRQNAVVSDICTVYWDKVAPDAASTTSSR
jgi:hypothetical protein